VIVEPALLSLLPAVPRRAPCELCGTEGGLLSQAVVIQRPDGIVLERGTCDACARAVRRLEAVSGRLAELVLGAPGSHVPVVEVKASLPVAPPTPVHWELILQLSEVLVAPDGTPYLVEVHGGTMLQGRWMGWLVFRPEAGRAGTPWLRTDRETTQPNRAALQHWAGTLGAAYIQGAFRRAQPYAIADARG